MRKSRENYPIVFMQVISVGGGRNLSCGGSSQNPDLPHNWRMISRFYNGTSLPVIVTQKEFDIPVSTARTMRDEYLQATSHSGSTGIPGWILLERNCNCSYVRMPRYQFTATKNFQKTLIMRRWSTRLEGGPEENHGRNCSEPIPDPLCIVSGKIPPLPPM